MSLDSIEPIYSIEAEKISTGEIQEFRALYMNLGNISHCKHPFEESFVKHIQKISEVLDQFHSVVERIDNHSYVNALTDEVCAALGIRQEQLNDDNFKLNVQKYIIAADNPSCLLDNPDAAKDILGFLKNHFGKEFSEQDLLSSYDTRDARITGVMEVQNDQVQKVLDSEMNEQNILNFPVNERVKALNIFNTKFKKEESGDRISFGIILTKFFKNTQFAVNKGGVLLSKIFDGNEDVLASIFGMCPIATNQQEFSQMTLLDFVLEVFPEFSQPSQRVES